MISRLLTVAFASCLVCLLFSCSRQVTDPPRAVAVSACANTIAGAHRLAANFGLRFDVPEDRFTVKKGQRDMPPEMLYVVTSNGHADAKLVVSRDAGDFRDLEVAYPTFSQHVGERTMRDAEGRSFGTDRWGYLQKLRRAARKSSFRNLLPSFKLKPLPRWLQIFRVGQRWTSERGRHD
jgi:hypothetical protein